MRLPRWISSLFLVALMLAVAVPPAGAADSVYWSNYEGGTISRAGLAGEGGSDLPIPEEFVKGPFGVAIDPAEGKIYWTNWNVNSIGVANLDGSDAHLVNTEGTTLNGPSSLAIDPATRRIYWVNSEANTISYANLNGSGGGTLDTTGASFEKAYGLAIFPAAGRVYWGDYAANVISYANLDGSGGGELDTTGAKVTAPVGLAIDAAANRVYWGNGSAESIASASLSGGAGANFDPGEAPVKQAEGLAIDPAASRIYWANVGLDTIGFAGLNGGPSGQVNTTGATTDYVSFPVLLKTPVSTSPPEITTAPKTAPLVASQRKGAPPFVASQTQTFNCQQGSWAPDLYEASLYRAPRTISYQWLRNERPIPGATATSYAATEVGDYACRVTATNGAGPTATETSPLNIQASFAVGKPTLSKKRGTAKLPFATSGSGAVVLGGRALKSKSLSSAAGSTAPLSGSILLKAKGKTLKKLRAKGKAKVRAILEFTPTDGSPLVATKSITLRLKH